MFSTVVIRSAHHDERHVVYRLSELDSAEMLTGEVLLAIEGDRAVAAISVHDGRVVADPVHLHRVRRRAPARARRRPP
jgi:hypothetical protein